jgi:phospholipid N-methyltransferase
MNIIKQIWHQVVPKPLRLRIYEIREKKINQNKRSSVLKYYQNHPTQDTDINNALVYLQNNTITALPYPFLDAYVHKEITVLTDPDNNLPYVYHGEEKLYFKRSWTVDDITRSYRMLLAEQDPRSPHRYLTSNYNIENNSVVVDIGAAEGIFALHEMTKISHLYLLEADEEWIESLQATYRKWADKVTIIKKFVSSKDDINHIRLDTCFSKIPFIDFLKIDVDGAESDLLMGGDQTIRQKVRKVVICTYHKKNDYQDFSIYLKNAHFKIHNSDRYLLFFYDRKFTPPFFRRALIRAEK